MAQTQQKVEPNAPKPGLTVLPGEDSAKSGEPGKKPPQKEAETPAGAAREPDPAAAEQARRNRLHPARVWPD